MLPVHARLELRELDEGFLVLPASQKLATRRQPQVHAGEGLHVPIVQRPCDAFSLRGCFQLADPRFEDHPLLSEVSDEVPGDDEIGRPHDVEVQALRARYDDQAEVEGDTRAGHHHRPPQAGPEPGRQHREGEEHVEGAVCSLGDERNGRAEQDVGPCRDDRDSSCRGELLANHEIRRHAVGEVQEHDGEGMGVQRERPAGERQPASQRRPGRVDVHHDERRHRQNHPAPRHVSFDLDERRLSHDGALADGMRWA